MKDTDKIVHAKQQNIQDDLNMGSDNGFDGLIKLLEASYTIELQLDLGGFATVKSADELKQYFIVG